ncbi:hypothetical protein ACI2LF_25620 [Kribbella sp. NPDC020789]
MRATYEDMLRVARRAAVDAARARYQHRAEAVDDWRAVVASSANHLRWLRHRLRTADLYGVPAAQSSRPLGRLAQAIGAGSDLLASQDAVTARALDNPSSLLIARAEIASIALTGAECAMGNTRSKTPERRRLVKLMAELDELASLGVRQGGLGELGELSSGGPVAGDGELSMLARYASCWERADDSVALESLLTRDLRSTTAQIRSVCGYVWHLTDGLLASSHADLESRQRLDLGVLKGSIHAAEAGALRVAESWRRRLSDLYGQTGTPSEAMFAVLKTALDGAVRPGGHVLDADVLIPDAATAGRLLEVVDELVWSAEQVTRRQQRAVAALISQGRFLVPRQDLSQLDLRYMRTPMHSRPLQTRWLRTTQPAFFAELTGCLAWSADHLALASRAARRLASTSQERRPDPGGPVRSPAPYLELPELPNTASDHRRLV